jgi:hypothetical protein
MGRFAAYQGLSAVGAMKQWHQDFEPKTLIENTKRAAGIEPASSAWKAEVLPLNYARKFVMAKTPQS